MSKRFCMVTDFNLSTKNTYMGNSEYYNTRLLVSGEWILQSNKLIFTTLTVKLKFDILEKYQHLLTFFNKQ